MNTLTDDKLIYRGSPVASSWAFAGLLLRDFFHAADGATLRQSLENAGCFFNKEQRDTLFSADWLAVEYDFNRLFVGPMKLLAPPYSSVYNDSDALLMGKSTQQVKEILNALNLNIANENQTPEDHISCEIELCLLLANNQPELLARFVTGHVNLWLPQFIEKIKEHAQTQPLQLAADLLSDWLSELKTRV